jgi:hypothetical protein
VTDLGRGGDRAGTRSTVQNLDFHDRQTTGLAKLEAALTGLTAGVVGRFDLTLVSVAAISLVEAGKRDLRIVV